MRFSALERQSGRNSSRRLARRAGRAARMQKAVGAQRGWPHMEALEGRVLFSGGLDPTFGAGGIVLTDLLSSASASAEAVVVHQADGRIVAAGHAATLLGDAAVARYNTDGSPDTSFGIDGRVQFPFAGGQITSAAIDTQGRIVLGGHQGGDFVALRLTSTGALDTTFGAGGAATIDLGSDSDIAFGIALDASGRIVLGGQTLSALTGMDFAAARLTSSGALDTTFGADGLVIIDFAQSHDAAHGIAIDSQGRIALGGFTRGEKQRGAFAVLRLAADGALDLDFAGGVPVTASVGPTEHTAYGVAIDSQDRIVLAGRGDAPFVAARFTEGGALDATFGDAGWVTDGGSIKGARGEARGVAIDSQDRVVLGGATLDFTKGALGAFTAVRFTPEGALDTTFAAEGRVILERDSSDAVFGVAIDTLDQVVLAGSSLEPNALDSDFTVARLTASGQLDAGFGAGGWVTTGFGISRDDIGQLVAVAPSGHIIVLGASASTSGAFASLSRYNPDGTIDTSFGDGGHIHGLPVDAVSIAVDAEGRILVAGDRRELGAAVARFTSSGDLDFSFGQAGVARIPGGHSFREATAVAVDSLGRIVVAGRTELSKFGFDFAAARLTTSGDLDTTFGVDGLARADFDSTSDHALTLTIDAHDRIILAGRSQTVGSKGSHIAAARFTASGALDTSFGAAGWVTPHLGSAAEEARGVAIDSQGRVVLAAFAAQPGGGAGLTALRLTEAGALDTSFDGDGWNAAGISADLALGVGIDAQDRVLLSGYTLGAAGFDFLAARFTPSGALDTTFGAGGIAIHDLGLGADDFASGMAVDALGNLLIVGQTFRPETGFDIALARLLAEPPTPPPSIVAVDVGRDFHTVQIDFEGQPLDHARATDASNYFILASGGDSNGDGDAFNDGDEVFLTIDSADYDAATGRVTLTTSEAIFDDQFRIGIDGDDATSDSAAGITDTLGRFLDGGDFTAVIDLQSLGMVGDLITHVEGLGLKTGAETSLVAKLEAAAKNLGMSVDSGMGVTAILSAFMKGVQQWFDRGEISQADHDLLLDRAQYIIDGLVALRM